jgi:hypothetical protein
MRTIDNIDMFFFLAALWSPKKGVGLVPISGSLPRCKDPEQNYLCPLFRAIPCFLGGGHQFNMVFLLFLSSGICRVTVVPRCLLRCVVQPRCWCLMICVFELQSQVANVVFQWNLLEYVVWRCFNSFTIDGCLLPLLPADRECGLEWRCSIFSMSEQHIFRSNGHLLFCFFLSIIYNYMYIQYIFVFR